ncbi:hypothetical protein PGT21_018293 [Puccinia graminis f. sp. tritici]|uniref:Uncharacterized protein n=1 Tax=Puccinia graminis f. sp. tritici TaxID=56615 RepID=A0A5B0LZZ6_PUCGR|nr:hypothetical protein PGT21_018293 [Puccinia graminis f. sp. tritici]
MPNLLQITEGEPETSVNAQLVPTTSNLPTTDSLDELQKIIIDMIMSYTIFQAHSQDQSNPYRSLLITAQSAATPSSVVAMTGIKQKRLLRDGPLPLGGPD